MNGDMPPGTRLPTTTELIAEFDVSNPTVQQALGTLKQEGFVEGRQGKGVFVRDRRTITVDVANYFQPAPGAYAYSVLGVIEVVPPAAVALALALDENGTAVLRRRLLTLDEDPVELSYSYYPADLVRDTRLTEKRKVPGGAPKVLADLGHPQAELVDDVSVRLPTTEELELLELPESVPVVQQFRTIYSDSGRPVEASILVKGGHHYVLRYRQQIH